MRADPDRWVEITCYPVNVGIGLATRRRGDDRPRPRHHRGPPSRGRPGDLHRRPVARAADAGDDDLRRRQAARPRAIDARRGHPPRDLPGHLRGGGAAPAAGRGRRRPQPLRRGGRRDRLGAGPAPATGAPRRRIGGGALAGRVVRARRSRRRCRRSRPTPPTSSRSSATSSPTRPSTAGPARPSRWPPKRATARCSSASSTTDPAFPPRRRTASSSSSIDRPARPLRATGAGIGLFVCARLVAAMGGRIWAVPRPTGGAEFGFALNELDE